MSNLEARLSGEVLAFIIGLALGFLGFFIYIIKHSKKTIETQPNFLMEDALKNNSLLKNAIMTNDQNIFYQKLKQIIGNNYLLFPRTQINNLVIIKSEANYYDRLNSLLRNIDIDYVICNKDLTPVLLVLVGGVKVNSPQLLIRNESIERLMQSLGIGMVYISSDMINEEELSLEIKNRLNPSSTPAVSL